MNTAPTSRPIVGQTMVVALDSPAAGGDTIARTAVGVIFVAGGIPAETVRIQITEVHKSFARAQVTEVLESSPHRVPDRRITLGANGVGGFEYAHVDLEYSRKLKAEVAADQFVRLGGLDLIPQVYPAPEERAGGHGHAWRTRVQLAVHKGRIGMYAPRSHRVMPVTGVPLGVPEFGRLSLENIDLTGVSRVELAAGTHSGAVVLQGKPSKLALRQVQQRLDDLSGDWSLLVTSSSRNRGGAGSADNTKLVSGTGMVQHRVGQHHFDVRATGFWQVHVDAATVLSEQVLAASQRARAVADLYCGAGLFTTVVGATTGARVYGVEGSRGAIEDAHHNAVGVNATFEVGRVEKLSTLPAVDTVIVDPPRAGCGRQVTELISQSSAHTLVYVSCNGATFARDAKDLVACGFQLESTRGFDLFPLTAHTEFVSVFRR